MSVDCICFFGTGTGRCGSMLLVKLLNAGANVTCVHEASMRYDKLAEAWFSNDHTPLYEEIDKVIKPEIERAVTKGNVWGEISGLLYFAFPEIYRIFGKHAHFLLLVRHPEEYVRSALARGFFDESHPYSLEHARPGPAYSVSGIWDELDPVEKNLWYWGAVNAYVLNFFDSIGHKNCHIIRLEDLCVKKVKSIYQALGIKEFNQEKIKDILAQPVNVSPQKKQAKTSDNVNPWSLPKYLQPMQDWPERWLVAYERWTTSIMNRLYPDLITPFSNRLLKNSCNKPVETEPERMRFGRSSGRVL